MKKLSTGQDSTLGNWIELSSGVFGKDSEATKFLVKKANDSPKGLNTEVISDEVQLLMVLTKLHNKGMY